jgi:hypothetical protein
MFFSIFSVQTYGIFFGVLESTGEVVPILQIFRKA